MCLYKHRYLIAKYETEGEDERLVAVGTTPEELGLTNWHDITHAVERTEIDQATKYRLYLIDCLEKHDDCFAEEDEIFLNEMREEYIGKTSAVREFANENNTTARRVWRLLKSGKLIYKDGKIYER